VTAGDALTAPIDIGAEVLPPFVRLPDLALVFARRAERCRELAEGHPLGPYLRFIADLAAAQDAALRQPLTVPGAAGPQAVGVPPLDKATWRGEGAWMRHCEPSPAASPMRRCRGRPAPCLPL